MLHTAARTVTTFAGSAAVGVLGLNKLAGDDSLPQVIRNLPSFSSPRKRLARLAHYAHPRPIFLLVIHPNLSARPSCRPSRVSPCSPRSLGLYPHSPFSAYVPNLRAPIDELLTAIHPQRQDVAPQSIFNENRASNSTPVLSMNGVTTVVGLTPSSILLALQIACLNDVRPARTSPTRFADQAPTRRRLRAKRATWARATPCGMRARA
jgi:hypothetical protein